MMNGKDYMGQCFIASIFGMLLLCTCTHQDVMDTPEAERSSGKTLKIYAEDYTADWREGTRSLTALSDELSKQIHNLYYFFYDAEGFLERIYYQDVTPTMVLEVPFSAFLNKDQPTGVTPHGHVYIVANTHKITTEGTFPNPILVYGEDYMSKGFDDLTHINEWKQRVATYPEFQKNAKFPIFVDATGGGGGQGGDWTVGRPDHLQMFGFFDGTLLHDNNLQIPLGRMVARIRIALSGNGLGKQTRIRVKNAARYTALYPNVEGGGMPTDTTKTEYWGTYEETIDTNEGISGNDGNYSASLFYYTGENNYNYTKVRTFLQIDTWDKIEKREETGKGTRRYELYLGNDSPDIKENRDYSLNRNTSYTFNVTLRNTASNAKEHMTRTAEPNKDGSITLYPIE